LDLAPPERPKDLVFVWRGQLLEVRTMA